MSPEYTGCITKVKHIKEKSKKTKNKYSKCKTSENPRNPEIYEPMENEEDIEVHIRTLKNKYFSFSILSSCPSKH